MLFYERKLIVKNDEGIREQHDWGELNKLLCEETTGDDEFTFGDMTYRPGGVRGPATGDEAFHTLRGEGIVRVWPVLGGDSSSVEESPVETDHHTPDTGSTEE